jgi:hypothetical protein
MNSKLLKKILKYDKKDLLIRISACQVPPVNKDKIAKIEYAIVVLLSLNFIKRQKKRISKLLIHRILSEAYNDFRKALKDESMIQRFFPIGFMNIKGNALPWQFSDAAIDRFSPHKKWMLANLGFSIEEAVHFSKEIIKSVTRRSLILKREKFNYSQDKFYNQNFFEIPSKRIASIWSSAITHTEHDLKNLFPNFNTTHNCILKRLSFNIDQQLSKINTPSDFNILQSHPFLKYNDSYILLLPGMLFQTLSRTFHYDIIKDTSYIGKYVDLKGKIAEKRVHTCFSKLYEKSQIQSRVRYGKHKGWPDIDLIVVYGNTALFIESSAKWITVKAKQGNLQSILDDLQTSIEKCSIQLVRANKAFHEGQVNINVDEIIPVIVLDDSIPGIEVFINSLDILKNPRPYIINTYDLDIISDFSNQNEFIDFIKKRIELSEKNVILAADELDYYCFYRMYGFQDSSRLKEKQSLLYYIGHIEDLDQTYYRRKFIDFIQDPLLLNQMESSGENLLFGWS